ncbi:putative ribosome quality control (RQC) complex component, YloA/Tae2 family [Aliarcobacter cibarius]|uniref:Putative ribosome quality control (RQC) complex component, YloA/Tae2 family n=1 Tax=Aliarcobacter cibarius TaxID=255507 RepID=A0A7L5JRW8_9BACT|nr:NFACT RNA binding domain-containing protein [Aliarcobacter cibarius]QKJ27964.1 putative ribosome quality control (RQC) complex component, YloA/Tae2 family [Aliarcobacter cibarius]
MKYFLLKAVCEYLKENACIIKFIKRIDNNIIIIEFNNKNIIYFDLSKSNAKIFKTKQQITSKKDFNAPFDVVLQKKFTNSKIENIELYNDDKIINIKVSSSSSYKKEVAILQLEFTGKYTNIIILDENRVILEALRHIDEYSSFRVVKVGVKLEEIPKKDFVPKIEKIDDIENYLYKIYEDIEKENLESVKKQKILKVDRNIKKLENILKSLPKKEELEIESNDTYTKANILIANLHNIKPYQKIIQIENYDGNHIEIELENMQNPSKYTNELFKKAKRLKQKAHNICIEEDNLKDKLEFAKRLRINIENSNSIDECEFLYPKKERNQTKTKKEKNYESFFYEGYKIMLGSNERENIYLLENSKASDFWFHLKDRPSCHVIVQNSKKELPPSVVQKAATLCVNFSIEGGGVFEVDYTQRRNVKIQHGANVLYNPYNTIVIKN